MQRGNQNAPLFWSALVAIAIADVVTKWIAVRTLLEHQFPQEVFGNTVRFALVYNRGAAFGLNVGEMSRGVFLVLTVAALFVLGRLYRSTPAGDWVRTAALALVCGGAVGNLIDRIRWNRGVVDFIDVGVGMHRWPTFNVADMAVSTGAVVLAWVLWAEDRRNAAAHQQAVSSPLSGQPGEGL